MRRWQSILAGLVALAALSSGCALKRPGNPFAAANRKAADAQADKKSAAERAPADETSVASHKMDLRPGDGTRGTAAPASPDSSGSESAGSRSTPYGGHDPKTMAYIESELRDATPEERTAMLANLRGMHPDAVRQILRGRRMGLNFKQQEMAAAARNSGATGKPMIQPVSSEVVASSGAGAERAQSPDGLGSTSAWSGQMQGGQTGANRATVDLAAAAVAAQNASAWSQNAASAEQLAAPPPAGHTSGYRVGAGAQDASAVVDNYSMPPPGAPSIRRVAQAGNPPGGGQFQVAPAGGTPAGRAQANRAQAQGAAVSVGTPMEAGGPQSTAAIPEGAPGREASGRDYLARLISATESEALETQPGETETQKQAYIEKQVHLRLLYLMSGQQERALQAIPGIDPADQEFWQQTFWGLTNYFDAKSIPSSADRAAQTITQLTNAVLRLQEKANLELRNVSFCHKISSFGNYEKFARDEFSPGQEVLVYAEVANTHSEPIQDGKYRTSLKSTIEIYKHGSQGELVEKIDLPETIDICRTHRRDYFHSYQFTIPTKLSLGPHVLKLSVEDQLSRRVGTCTLNFMVK